MSKLTIILFIFLLLNLKLIFQTKVIGFLTSFPIAFVQYNKSILSLQHTFINGINFCNTKHISANREFEMCVVNFVKNCSDSDYKTLIKINTFCGNTTTCEAERRNCIDKILTIK